MTMTSEKTDGLFVSDLTKAFSSNLVLRGVNLSFERGKVHALLGPNGAGKSTLLGCLSGAVQPDSGVIRIGGIAHSGFTPKSAFEAGTAIIYQHFQLIPSLSVSDNVFLGVELRTGWGTTDFRNQERVCSEIFAELHVDIDPRSLVGDLSVGEQQVVEIARALHKDPSVLILDEPTAALSESEVSSLLKLVRVLATERNLVVIYVTHLLREVMQVADVVTVLQDGVVGWTRPTEELELNDLIAAISPEAKDIRRRTHATSSRVVLKLSSFTGTRTGPIDLDVKEGEIIGIFGLLGSGRTDLAEAIAGVRQHTGSIAVNGVGISRSSPLEARRRGIVLVASDRKAQSLFGEMSAEENLLIPHYSSISRVVRSRKRERTMFQRTAQEIGLRPLNSSLEAARFSGGNAQKLAVGRWMTDVDDGSVIVLDEPTQGVDVGSRGELYELLRTYASGTKRAVIFTSSDPDEILTLADRVLILVDGSLVAETTSQVTEKDLLAYAHSGNH